MHLLCIAHALALARAYSSAPASLRRQAAPLLPYGQYATQPRYVLVSLRAYARRLRSAIALRAIRYAAALCSRFTASIRAAMLANAYKDLHK